MPSFPHPFCFCFYQYFFLLPFCFFAYLCTSFFVLPCAIILSKRKMQTHKAKKEGRNQERVENVLNQKQRWVNEPLCQRSACGQRELELKRFKYKKNDMKIKLTTNTINSNNKNSNNVYFLLHLLGTHAPSAPTAARFLSCSCFIIISVFNINSLLWIWKRQKKNTKTNTYWHTNCWNRLWAQK